MGQLPTPVMGISKRWWFLPAMLLLRHLDAAMAEALGLVVQRICRRAASAIRRGARDAPYLAKLVEISKSTVGFVMCIYIWVSINVSTPIVGWFKRENPSKIDDLGVPSF